ncbi:MAG: hypothetical protein UT58_C0010G0010 [Microgenomates group bacterium GW2011_GWC1_39_7b]|nr:MAG: hypothetical protein UT58_C0010G0010 [Microgenomates group bacterium GW2011_GWC1_39_7b]
MRIAIDISQAIFGTGVSTYTKSLVQGLLSLDKNNDYLLFGSRLLSGLLGMLMFLLLPIGQSLLPEHLK